MMILAEPRRTPAAWSAWTVAALLRHRQLHKAWPMINASLGLS
jgi:hypothetical protein